MIDKNIKAMIFAGIIILIHGCGGSGGDSGLTTSPSKMITFRSSTLGDKTVNMVQNSSISNGDTLAIDVLVNNLSNVYGAGFDVDFDPSKLIYAGYVAGSFLEKSGDTVNYIITTQTGNSGKLIAGISRLGSVGGVSGNGKIVTLKFKVVASGSTSLSFSNNVLMDAANLSIPGLTWNSGLATIFF